MTAENNLKQKSIVLPSPPKPLIEMILEVES
jgi:hypothetical protein